MYKDVLRCIEILFVIMYVFISIVYIMVANLYKDYQDNMKINEQCINRYKECRIDNDK